jgi:twitching motility protein PilT
MQINDLLVRMKEVNSSDLILTTGSPPQYRINGLLQPHGGDNLNADDTRSFVDALVAAPDREVLEEERSIDFSKGLPGIARFRFNVYYQRDSLALAIRIIPLEIPPFDELGCPEITRELADRPHGLVLITGPAGSGKSTTMAAMIDHINTTRNVHVVCIEDPIEYIHHHRSSVVDQREIGEDARTFTEALRTVFRQSPDVIMVGEMRDLETIALALTLAETGHLIMGTLHTQDTTNAINRIIDVFPEGQQQQVMTQLSLTLIGIIAQQLLVTSDGTGRVLAYEVLNVDNAISNLIREGQLQQLYSVIQTGRSRGMVTMNESLQRLHNEGLVDSDTALQRSPRPKELARQINV